MGLGWGVQYRSRPLCCFRRLSGPLARHGNVGSSCDALELPAPSHARLLARSGAAVAFKFGRTGSGHWQRGRRPRWRLRRPLALALACNCLEPGSPLNLARLLARKPWTPRAFRAKGIKSTETPHFAPSAKFQLMLQARVFPTSFGHLRSVSSGTFFFACPSWS